MFCILWVWHVLWTEQCGLLARMAALGCLSKWVTHLWHLANPKACFSVLVGSCTFFSVCLGLYTPQHSLFAAVTNVTQKVASYINWKKSGTVLSFASKWVHIYPECNAHWVKKLNVDPANSLAHSFAQFVYFLNTFIIFEYSEFFFKEYELLIGRAVFQRNTTSMVTPWILSMTEAHHLNMLGF